MSALAHFIEDEGVATACISLVREHTERMKPPRALWVPFELGRPLGVPGDAAFQHRVLASILELFRASVGPVLKDYDEDAPSADNADEWVCPVSFAPPEKSDNPVAATRQEMAQLEPWFELAQRTRQRTTTGVDGLTPQTALDVVARTIEHTDVSKWGKPRQINLAVEELKAFYLESVTARPGQTRGSELSSWLWRETHLGALLRLLDSALRSSDVDALRLLAERNLIPREYR